MADYTRKVKSLLSEIEYNTLAHSLSPDYELYPVTAKIKKMTKEGG